MWVAHYYLLGFFDGPATEPEPEPAAAGGAVYGGRRISFDDIQGDDETMRNGRSAVMALILALAASGELD